MGIIIHLMHKVDIVLQCLQLLLQMRITFLNPLLSDGILVNGETPCQQRFNKLFPKLSINPLLSDRTLRYITLPSARPSNVYIGEKGYC